MVQLKITYHKPLEISDKTIHHPDKQNNELYLVPVPTNHLYHSSRLLNIHLKTLKNLQRYYKSNEVFSYEDALLRAKPKEITDKRFSKVLTLLWIRGKLEKYAKGEYGAGFDKKYCGKYYGVHYRLTE